MEGATRAPKIDSKQKKWHKLPNMGSNQEESTDKKDWTNRWKEDRIRFHQKEISPYLKKFFNQLKIPPKSHCFIPLCGKSIDMRWIMEQGHLVTGIEYSNIAIQSFFAENDLSATPKSTPSGLPALQSELITLVEGDFFKLPPSDISPVDWIFDRAALIAIPKSGHARYAKHLQSFLRVGGQILLITLDYAERESEGPPFPASQDDIKVCFGDNFLIELLESEDVLTQIQHLRERGLSWLRESVFLLTKKK